MGAVLGIPLVGMIGGLGLSAGSACVSALACFCTAQAASSLTRSCNCNSSIATRIGFSIIFLFNSLLAWIMLSEYATALIAKYTFDWIKNDCQGGQCFGVLAVHRVCFALALFHTILSLSLINVKDTRSKRAALQNGWWGPKVGIWLLLIALTFLIPNGFFLFYSSYISIPGATIFILIGLILLVDFAHSWSEQCLENWESNPESNLWKYILIGSTFSLFAIAITLIGLQYGFFAGSGCGLNQFFITLNLILSILVTLISINPIVQSHNPKSGLAQSGMVIAYTAYLVMSAIANHDDVPTQGQCNPLAKTAAGARTGMIILGAIFTFLAIAYSTSRAATMSGNLLGVGGGGEKRGEIRLREEEEDVRVSEQPKGEVSIRTRAIMAAVAAGSLPASALTEETERQQRIDDEDSPGNHDGGEDNDDEYLSTRYNYSWFHVIFVLATMYVAMLLTNWNILTVVEELAWDKGQPIKIGRSHVAMWMRIVSSWVCYGIYGWTLVAPIVLEGRDF